MYFKANINWGIIGHEPLKATSIDILKLSNGSNLESDNNINRSKWLSRNSLSVLVRRTPQSLGTCRALVTISDHDQFTVTPSHTPSATHVTMTAAMWCGGRPRQRPPASSSVRRDLQVLLRMFVEVSQSSVLSSRTRAVNIPIQRNRFEIIISTSVRSGRRKRTTSEPAATGQRNACVAAPGCRRPLTPLGTPRTSSRSAPSQSLLIRLHQSVCPRVVSGLCCCWACLSSLGNLFRNHSDETRGEEMHSVTWTPLIGQLIADIRHWIPAEWLTLEDTVQLRQPVFRITARRLVILCTKTPARHDRVSKRKLWET